MVLISHETPSVRDQRRVFEHYRTGLSGLTVHEAALRHRVQGANELPRHHDTTIAIALRQLRNPLLLILLFAAAASFYLGQRDSAITIVIMMAASIILGFVNEYRSEKIIQHLHAHIQPTTTVLRNNKPVQIPTRTVVTGDVVPLLPGTIVPADMRIVDAEDLQINEAILTGESLLAQKSSDASIDAKSQFMQNCAYFGTHIASGHGLGVVYGIGQATVYGSIAGSLESVRPEGDFAKGIHQFGNFLTRVVIIIAIIIFAVNASMGRPLIDSLLFTLAIAIGLTPELLPAIVSFSMARGAANLARKRVVVKRLVAIEDLGNLDVLCTDKTGTMTEGVMHLHSFIDATRGTNKLVLQKALWFVERARKHHPVDSPFDDAVLRYKKENDIDAIPARYIASLPFDFNRRRASKLILTKGHALIITRGAPEPVLAACNTYYTHSGIEKLDKKTLDLLEEEFKQLSEQGLRVIALASKATDKTTLSIADEQQLTFDGFLVFEDRVKPSVINTVKKLAEEHVRLVLVSGDNELVCRHVCKGIMNVDHIVTGDTLEQMTDLQLDKALHVTDIFARVSPEQKVRIIRGFKRLHSSVGFLGDGVNDAPVLHEADVGISVSTAVDIAKDAANIVLLKNDLTILAEGILEGRRIFSNTIKYIYMGTSSNFGNMISAAIGSFILPFLPMLPVQILLTNVLYDVSQLAIPTDSVDSEDLKKPRHWDVSSIQRFMLFFGPISSLYDLATFAVMLVALGATVHLFQTGWYIESLITQTLVVFVFRTKRVPFFKSMSSKFLIISALLVIAIGIAIPYSSLGVIFEFQRLPLEYLGIFIIMAVLYLAAVDTLKGVFYRMQRSSAKA